MSMLKGWVVLPSGDRGKSIAYECGIVLSNPHTPASGSEEYTEWDAQIFDDGLAKLEPYWGEVVWGLYPVGGQRMKNPRAMATLLPETTGQLDRVISEMKMHAKHAAEGAYPYDEADIQTLKHHAEDMVAMGQYILNKLEVSE